MGFCAEPVVVAAEVAASDQKGCPCVVCAVVVSASSGAEVLCEEVVAAVVAEAVVEPAVLPLSEVDCSVTAVVPPDEVVSTGVELLSPPLQPVRRTQAARKAAAARYFILISRPPFEDIIPIYIILLCRPIVKFWTQKSRLISSVCFFFL